MPLGLRIWWFRILADLNRAGFPSAEVSNQIHVPRQTLRDWSDGAEPRHADGEALLDFWCKVFDKTREDAPTEDYAPKRRVLPRRK